MILNMSAEPAVSFKIIFVYKFSGLVAFYGVAY
jgi:hypothetical protein